MESYYASQASLPHFSGHYRQRGSGFGALAAGIGRFALPVAKKFVVPAAKKLGREFIRQAAPELLDVITKKASPKRALKNSVRKTIRKQVGGSAKRRTKKRADTRRSKQLQRHTAIKRNSRRKRSRVDFFSKVKNDR